MTSSKAYFKLPNVIKEKEMKNERSLSVEIKNFLTETFSEQLTIGIENHLFVFTKKQMK